MADEHGTHHEPLPDETTPQGTQEDAVEFGHEGTDINIRQVVYWFLGTLVSTIVIQALLLGAWAQWRAAEDRETRVPSPIFLAPQVPPPPRLEPNPADAALPEFRNQPMRLGPDVLHDYRAQEDAQLQKLGLQNPATGLPDVPPAVLQTVTSSGAGPLPVPPGTRMAAETPSGSMGAAPPAPSPSTPDALVRPMPSEASGGTAMENELR